MSRDSDTHTRVFGLGNPLSAATTADGRLKVFDPLLPVLVPVSRAAQSHRRLCFCCHEWTDWYSRPLGAEAHAGGACYVSFGTSRRLDDPQPLISSLEKLSPTLTIFVEHHGAEPVAGDIRPHDAVGVLLYDVPAGTVVQSWLTTVLGEMDVEPCFLRVEVPADAAVARDFGDRKECFIMETVDWWSASTASDADGSDSDGDIRSDLCDRIQKTRDTLAREYDRAAV
jgi:hypothetical protein